MKIFLILFAVLFGVLCILYLLLGGPGTYRPGKLKAPPPLPKKSTSVKEFK